jgi:hypothetical protein
MFMLTVIGTVMVTPTPMEAAQGAIPMQDIIIMVGRLILTVVLRTVL